jgi:hypothetical protein
MWMRAPRRLRRIRTLKQITVGRITPIAKRSSRNGHAVVVKAVSLRWVTRILFVYTAGSALWRTEVSEGVTT